MFTTKARALRVNDVVPYGVGLYGFGANASSQLGLDNSETMYKVPTKVGIDTVWKQISCGDTFVLAIKQDGTLWTWGYSTHPTMGTGTSNVIFPTPTQIGIDNDWDQVSCGKYYSAAIKKDGTLWTCGYEISSVFTKVGTFTDWSQVSCGYDFIAAIRSGKLFTWGKNNEGQLGHGGFTDVVAPKQVGVDSDWEQIRCGFYHCIAIKGGKLYSWGDGETHQLGYELGSYDSIGSQTFPKEITDFEDRGGQWTKLIVNASSNAALKGNTIYVWGSNNFGQLGVGDVLYRHYLTILDTLPEWVNDFYDMSITYTHGALSYQGELYVWGANNNGQLGLGDTISRLNPVKLRADNNWMNVSCGPNYTLATRR